MRSLPRRHSLRDEPKECLRGRLRRARVVSISSLTNFHDRPDRPDRTRSDPSDRDRPGCLSRLCSVSI